MDLNVCYAPVKERCCLIIHSPYTVCLWAQSLPLYLCSSSHTISFIDCLSCTQQHIWTHNTLEATHWSLSTGRWGCWLSPYSSPPPSPAGPPSIPSGFSALLVFTWAITRLISYSRNLAYWTEQMKGREGCVWRSFLLEEVDRKQIYAEKL